MRKDRKSIDYLHPGCRYMMSSLQDDYRLKTPCRPRPARLARRVGMAAAAKGVLADRYRDKTQKFVVRHRLFQHGHNAQGSSLALDLGIMDAGYQ
jgi:hypothetical protein